MRFFTQLAARFRRNVPLKLHNTLTGHDDVFELPLGIKHVRMYNCGPTVYGVQHIGNLSMYVFTDVLRRVLEYNGYEVKQVINITDVGHLSSDADSGEDKMTLGLKREGLDLTLENMRSLAERYTALFLSDIAKLGIDTSKIEFPRASDYIAAQVAMVQTLEEKGYAYLTHDGVYFDTSRFPAYGKLGNIDLAGLREGARVAAGEKRNPTDFALWKFDKKIGWSSPWGKGFPGWHIECSAMIRSTLGQQIDIHTGGIEHIPVHHNNEIAQSECATGKHPLSRFWLHRAHIQIEGGKIAKSQGNVVYLSEILDRGFDALALRYLFLGAHYRTSSNFSWEALQGAQNSLDKLRGVYRSGVSGGSGSAARYERAFLERINDDLDTPGALAVLWEMTKDEHVSPAAKRSAAERFERIFGIGLFSEATQIVVPPEIEALAKKRVEARKAADYALADSLRTEIEEHGFSIKDTDTGPLLIQKRRN